MEKGLGIRVLREHAKNGEERKALFPLWQQKIQSFLLNLCWPHSGGQVSVGRRVPPQVTTRALRKALPGSRGFTANAQCLRSGRSSP